MTHAPSVRNQLNNKQGGKHRARSTANDHIAEKLDGSRLFFPWGLNLCFLVCDMVSFERDLYSSGYRLSVARHLLLALSHKTLQALNPS